MPSTSRARRGQRQREVAEAAEPVDHALVGLRVEQAHAPRHQHAVDVRIDLREVGRPERHRRCRTRAADNSTRRRRRRAARTVSGPLGCSHHCTPCTAPKSRSALAIGAASGSRWRSTSARTSSPHASSICGRRSRASIEPISSRSGSSSALTCGGSTWHSRHVGHVARLALVKTHQHGALLAPRGAPTAARASGSPRPAPAIGRSTRSGSHLAQVPQVVLQHALLDGHLRRRRAGAASCSRRRRRACRPKCGQRGARAANSRAAAPSACPAPSWFLRRDTDTCTRSPGSAPSMNTTLPSARCATPCASRSSDSTCSHCASPCMAPIIDSGRCRKQTGRTSAARQPHVVAIRACA